MNSSANVFVAMLQSGRRLVDKFLPPREWTVPVILTAGTFCGLGIAILHISNADSYLSDDPRACLNCHIMAPQFATWQRGSHARVATCNDCHVPHDNIFRKYFFKAMDGSRHAFMFTFHLEPQVIRVHEPGIRVIQENCMHCHEHLLQDTRLSVATGEMALHGEGRLCWDCHRETPHGSVNSLASVPNARVPFVSPVVPEWLTAFLEKNKSMGRNATPGRQQSKKTMRRISDIVSEKAWVGWLLFIGTLVAVFLIGLLGASIIERRQEAFITQQVKPLPEWEPRNEVWGQNFPREF